MNDGSHIQSQNPWDDREDVELARRIVQDDPDDPAFSREELVRILRTGNRTSRIAAIAALSPAIDSPEVISAMKQALDDGPDLVRLNICCFFAEAGSKARGAMPELRRWAQDAQSDFTRAAAEIAILRITLPNEESIPQISAYLDQDNPMITAAVLHAFAGMPDMADQLIPIIEPLAKHQSNWVRPSALRVLEQLRQATDTAK
ncbi:MAG: HEAT repeat domain-containing protein [Phycisphaerales bacterium]